MPKNSARFILDHLFNDERKTDIIGDVDATKSGMIVGSVKGIVPRGILVSAFAYTISRFSGDDSSMFSVSTNDGILVPMRVGCTDMSTSDFVRETSEIVDRLLNSVESDSDIPKEYRHAHNLVISSVPRRRGKGIEMLIVHWVEGGTTKFKLSYSKEHSRATMRRFLDSFVMITIGLSSCDLLSEICFTSAEDIKIQDRINKTEHPLRYNDIIEAFEEKVSVQPDRVLVTYLDRSYTYGEADRITDGIAYALSEKGIGKGDMVAVLVPRSEWYLLAAIAVLKTGAAYVPIDDSYPDERIGTILSDSSSKAMLVTIATMSRASSINQYFADVHGSSFKVDIVDVSSVGDAKECHHKFEPTDIDADDGSVILYTSGTTGVAKGVSLSHHNVMNYCEWFAKETKMDSSDRFLLYCSFGFDVHLEMFYSSIISGCCIDIVPENIRLELPKLKDYIVERKVTMINLPTAVGRMFVQLYPNLPIKSMWVGGEKLGRFDVDTNYTLYDTYGPTESTVSVTYTKVIDKIDSSSIGFPVSNVKLHILDREKRNIPFGAVGELHISGAQIASEYLNLPEKTAESFIRIPSNGLDSGVLIYATGDYARYLPDNSIAYMGRRDGQVKIRGNRVELAEVESTIRSLGGVKDVTVQVIANDTGSKELCAYIVPTGNVDSLTSESVQSHISERKPAFMVPSYVVFLDSVPLNSNGKVDKKALPQPDTSASRKEYTAPRNGNERKLCEAFAEVLGIENIGIDDDFIQLGGDSLKAIRVQNISDVSTTADILRYRSPRMICEHRITKECRNIIYTLETGCPLSESQLNVYLDIIANEKKGTYVILFEYKIPYESSLDEAVVAIRKALVIHPILSSHIETRNGEPWMSSVDTVTGRSYSPVDVSYSPITDRTVEVSDVDIYTCLSSFSVFGGRITGMISHIAFDGFSVSVLTETFDKVFSGEDVERDIGFLMSSSFDSLIRGSERYSKSKEFFDRMFCDADADTGLIDDIDGSNGSLTHTISISSDKIGRFVSDNGTSAGAFLASAFAYTLSRFTGRSDAVFTIVENGRELPGLENAVGMFVRTIPIRIDCSDSEVKEFVKGSAETIYTAMASAIFPFRLVHKSYGVSSDVIFQYVPEVEASTNAIKRSERMSEDEESDDMLSVATSICDLSVVVKHIDGKFVLSITHSSKYSNATAKRIADAFDMIVTGLLSESRLSDIRFTSTSDIALHDSINRTEHELRYNDIIEAFKEKVSIQPEHVLVTYLDRSYTYGEADRITDGIAYALSEKGIGKGDNVAVLVPRSEWYLLAAIAVLKTGAAYVPVDDSYPDERIEFMISDSSAKAVLVTRDTIEVIKRLFCSGDVNGCADNLSASAPTTSILPMDAIVDVTSVRHHAFERAKSSRDDIAVILYTSGTTGRPKGSRISGLALLSFSEWYATRFGFVSDDIYGMFSSFVFDAHIMALYPPLISGGSVDIVPEDVRLDIKGLNDHFVAMGVTHTFLTTQVGKMFVLATDRTPLRVLTVGGEKLGDVPVPEGYDLYDGYGPTENTVFTSVVDVRERTSASSLGRPNDNIKAYILDKEGRRIPNGAVGELYLSGYQLSKGYLNRDDLNATAFMDNPFVSEDEAKHGYGRMYATGDYFRYLPDGTLGIIGRRDGQVKIRGNRVELTEVEAVIRSMDTVNDVTVQAIVNNSGGKELCAYVVIVGSSQPGASEIQSFVAERKPAYMVPSYVVFLDSIPLNVNGKVDRRALPKPDMSSVHKEYVAPRNDNEKILCEAFAEVLGIENIGIDDDFIQLGGDSLKAIKVQNISKVSTTADILRYCSPRMICKHCIAKDYRTDLYTIDTGCPLSESQLNVYLDIIANEKKGTYIISFEYVLPKRYSRKEAIVAIYEAVCIHPILNSHVEKRDGGPWVVCNESSDTGTGECISDSPIQDIDVHVCLSSFHVSGNKIVGLISHIAFDGFSISVLTGTFDRIFSGENVERDIGFLMSSSFDTSIRDGERYSKSKEFFDRMFCDADTDSGLIDDVDGNVGSISSVLTAPFADIDRLLRTGRTSAGAFFASAFAYTLSRFTGRSDAVFTIAENGRDLPGLEDSVGMFVRTIPMRIDCSDRKVAEFLRDSADIVYGAMSSAIYPFRQVHNAYGVRSDVIFQYMAGIEATTSPDGALASDGTLPVGESSAESNDMLSVAASISDISVAVKDLGGKISISITHSSRYSDATAKRIADAFDMIVTGLLSESRLSDIRFTSTSDIALQDSINRTEHPMCYNDIIEAFKEKVREQPDHILVTYLDRTYTYAEADRITDGIAYALSKNGISKGDNVAILVPRSEWYLLAALAVLKIGATYVPIDDSYPDERIGFMISDSSAKAVLVTKDTVEVAKRLSDSLFIDVGDVDFHTFDRYDIADTAAILYTSGTTGVPKGAKISNAGIVNMSGYYVSFTSMTERDSYGLFSSIGFDAPLIAFYSSIVSGASVDIVPEKMRLDMKKLNEHFASRNITHTLITTQLGRIFASMEDTKSLSVLFVGGEKLGAFEAPIGLKVVDAYGPTEASVFICCTDISDRMSPDSIGRLNDNVKVYILDKEGRRLPNGAVGELYISGCQLSSGYLNREDLNATAFRNNPFVSEDEANHGYGRMYATGDYFRYLPDGTLGIIGRRDGQVKIRGNRVELTEVESVIRSMDMVKDVTVQAIVNDSGGKELCAYVVIDTAGSVGNGPRGIDPLTSASVQSYVSKRKPAYMVPSYVVFLDSIPLNINGKVDRRALPKPDTSASSREYVAPRNVNERKLCEAFAEVLGMEKVGIDDDFLQLGGDSLKAIRITARFNADCRGGSLSTPVIMKSRSPRLISQNLKTKVDFDENKYSYKDGCPLTSMQCAIFNFSVHTGMNVSIPEVMTDDSWTSAEDVRDALLRLISVHPILGSCIVQSENGEPWLSFSNEVDIPIIDAEPKSFSSTFYGRFDMENGVLTHFAVVRWEGRIYAFMHISHIIYDAYSSAILHKDFSRLIMGEDVELDTGVLRLAAYDRALHSDEEYIKRRNSMIGEIIASDVSRSDDPIYVAGDVVRRVKFKGLDDCAMKFDTSLGYLLSSIFAFAICRTMKERKCSFALIDSGRGNFDFIDSVGLFMNSIDVSVSGDTEDLRGFIRKSIDDIYRFVDAGMTTEWSIDNKNRYITRYMFDYVNIPIPTTPVDIDFKPPDKFFNDLFAFVNRDGDSLTMSFMHSDRFDVKTVETILGHFIDGIREISGSSGPDDVG